MRKYIFISLLISTFINCKSNTNEEVKTNDSEIENVPPENSSVEIESTKEAKYDEKMLFGTWKLVKTEAKLEHLIDSVYLNFYDDLSFNKKVNGYYTPRVPFKISASSEIRLYNRQASSDLAKLLSVTKDTLKLHLNTDNALGVFVNVPLDD